MTSRPSIALVVAMALIALVAGPVSPAHASPSAQLAPPVCDFPPSPTVTDPMIVGSFNPKVFARAFVTCNVPVRLLTLDVTIGLAGGRPVTKHYEVTNDRFLNGSVTRACVTGTYRASVRAVAHAVNESPVEVGAGSHAVFLDC